MNDHINQCLKERAKTIEKGFTAIEIENDRLIAQDEKLGEYTFQWEPELYKESLKLNDSFKCFSHHINGKFVAYELTSFSSEKNAIAAILTNSKKTIRIDVSENITDTNLLYEMLLNMICFIKTKSPYRLKSVTRQINFELSEQTIELLKKRDEIDVEILDLIS